MNALPWLILLLPLGAAAVITLFTQRDRNTTATLSIGAVLAGFVLSIIFVAVNGWEPATKELSATWLKVGELDIQFGLRLDALSLLMMLVVTGVASVIHIYSLGYMRGDAGYSRFFACLSLFTFSMLGIVLSNNFLQLFIFWELVGVSSYLLIGHWYERPSAADAAKKAFITNRLGDFGFLLGILTIWGMFKSLSFEGVTTNLSDFMVTHSGPTPVFFAAGLLIFCGAVGKSAQFPLHVWLPDAMEGPTPVSALIHAATMVAAGVYMLCRVFFLIEPSGALTIISYIGGFTALLAAVIAVQQNDIKRILAYSTLSQLGYMVMAVGLSGQSGPTPAMFHLTTHAFFKALLFLGAGSVIIALHHEQDIWKMGALRKKMPVTFWTFMAGTLALAGLWPFSGFFSKDSILALAARHNLILFMVGVVVAALTTFYMFRLVFVVFFGARRTGVSPVSDPNSGARVGDESLRQAGSLSYEPHESPGVMVWPLRVLAVFSVIGGIIGVEAVFGRMLSREHGEEAGSVLQQLITPFVHAPVAATLGLLAVAAGFAAAYVLYAKADKDPLPEKLGAFSRAMRNRFYFDELYEATFIRLHDFLAAIAAWIDRWIIAGLGVRGAHGTTEIIGRALRLLQTGNLQMYAFLFALGVALVLWLALGK